MEVFLFNWNAHCGRWTIWTQDTGNVLLLFEKCDETFAQVEKANEEDFKNGQRKYMLETFS